MKYVVRYVLMVAFLCVAVHAAEQGGGVEDLNRSLVESPRIQALRRSSSGTLKRSNSLGAADDDVPVEAKFGGSTALSLAVQRGSFNAAQVLVENGVDVNMVDASSRAPIHHALINRDKSIFNLLIGKTSTENINRYDADGLAPLHYAILWGDSDVTARLIKEKKADKALKTGLGKSPLELLAVTKHQDEIRGTIAKMLTEDAD